MKISKFYLPGIFLLIQTLAPLSSRAQDTPLITEFLAVNAGGLADEDGEYSDWLELYNPAANAVNLDGWFLTDNIGLLVKWQFPATNLAAHSYLVVFASGKDRANVGAPLHTNFRLSSDGELLALVRPDGSSIVSYYAPRFPAQTANISYGLGMLAGPLTSLVVVGAPAKALVPTADVGTAWTGIGYDDSSWLSGATGVGFDTGTNYDTAISTDLQAQMLNGNPSAYVRVPFTVADPSQFQEMTLRMQYDDGFIAYLNGVEVARNNAPPNAVWNSTATDTHGSEPGAAGVLQTDFDSVSSAYTPSQQGVAPGPTVMAANAGSTGQFLRLLNDGINGQVNSIAFHQTAAGLFPLIDADFDFRITDTANDPADGFAFMLIPTSQYATTGVGISAVGGVEKPNFANVFAIGFDMYPHGTVNDVSAHWNGTEYENYTIPTSTIDMVSGQFHHCHITLAYVTGGARVTVVITPNINGTPGAPFTAINQYPDSRDAAVRLPRADRRPHGRLRHVGGPGQFRRPIRLSQWPGAGPEFRSVGCFVPAPGGAECPGNSRPEHCVHQW